MIDDIKYISVYPLRSESMSFVRYRVMYWMKFSENTCVIGKAFELFPDASIYVSTYRLMMEEFKLPSSLYFARGSISMKTSR